MTIVQDSRRTPGWLRVVFGTSSSNLATDLGLLAARVVLGWVFIYYGGAKLFGAFGGPAPHGIHNTGLYFSNTAHLHPGELFAVVAGVIEFGGGIAIAVGLLARLAGLALFGDMAMAMITVTWATGLSSVISPPGYQLNIALAALALVVALGGPGRISLDAWIGQRLLRRRG